eukprot:g34491.t1
MKLDDLSTNSAGSGYGAGQASDPPKAQLAVVGDILEDLLTKLSQCVVTETLVQITLGLLRDVQSRREDAKKGYPWAAAWSRDKNISLDSVSGVTSGQQPRVKVGRRKVGSINSSSSSPVHPKVYCT